MHFIQGFICFLDSGRNLKTWTEPEIFKKVQGLLVRKTWTAFQVRLKEPEIIRFIQGFICFLDSGRNLKTWTEPEIFKKVQGLLVRKTWTAFQVRLKEPEIIRFIQGIICFFGFRPKSSASNVPRANNGPKIFENIYFTRCNFSKKIFPNQFLCDTAGV